VPHIFSAGDPILASEINNNYDNLDQRLARFEDSQNQTIPINCGAGGDVNALINTVIEDRTTYVLTGMCDGPIEVIRRRNVFIQGDATGIKDDGIILPANLQANPFAALGIYESNVDLSNLTIDASNYVTSSYPFGATNVSALSIGQSSTGRIRDLDITGGDTGLNVFRNSWVKTYSNINISGFNVIGLSSFAGSSVELSDTIQVVGGATTTSQNPEAISATYNSIVEIGNGGTFTPAGSGLAPENHAIGAGDNATVRVRDSGVTNLNADVGAWRSSSIKVDGGAVFNGGIGVYDTGTIRVTNSTHSGGFIEAHRGAVLRFISSSIDTATGGPFIFDLTAAATVRIQDTSVTLGDPINLFGYSLLQLKSTLTGDTNFISGDVNCHDRANQISVDANVTGFTLPTAGCL